MKIAVVGATGMVGNVMLKVLEERNLPINKLLLVASERSVGTELIFHNKKIKVIQFFRNYGKSAALSEGFRYCSGDYVITLDADLQDDPSEIKNLISEIEKGYDLVSGWKKDRKDPLSKKIPSKFFNIVTRLSTGVLIHDFNCGLKAYKKSVVKSIDIYGGRHRYIPALAGQKKFKVSELIVNHRQRLYGETKYGGSRFFHGFFDLISISFVVKFIFTISANASIS